MSLSRKNKTTSSTSAMMTYLEATFSSPEQHPEAQPMREFYKGIEAAIQAVRSTVPNADSDLAFKKAADIFSQLTPACQNMESLPPTAAAQLMQDWIKATQHIGAEGVMDVQGEASKLLAEKYIELFSKLINKEIWPISSPRFSTEYLPDWAPEVGPSFSTVYAINYRNFNADKMRETVATLQQRVADYDKGAPALETKIEIPEPTRAFKF